MKRYEVFASADLIMAIHIISALPPIFLILVDLIVIHFKVLYLLYAFLAYGIMYGLFLGIFSLIHRRAYCKVHIDETGIGNKYLFYKWEEIKKCDTAEVKLFDKSSWPTINLTSLLCIGELDGHNITALKQEKCVFVALNKKNQRLIHDLSQGKSRAVSQVLRLHSKEILK